MQFLANGIVAAAIYALVALGFSLIYSSSRFFHFAHGATYTLGAYTVYLFAIILRWDLWAAIPLGLACSALLGALMELAVYRPLRARHASAEVLLLASLGLYVTVQNLISMGFGDSARFLLLGPTKEGLLVVGARITPVQVVIIATSSTVISAMLVGMRLSSVGKIVRAVANNIELAKAFGIKTDSAILLVMMLGSALAAGAAVLAALNNDLTPTMGFNALLMAVVAVIVGGIGSIGGTVLAALLVGLCQQLVAAEVSTQWQDPFIFIVLILFLILRPQGFSGKPLRGSEI
jgi:branched-chain amino acid transport system permease protein